VPEWVYTFYKILVRIGLVGVLVWLGRWLLTRKSELPASQIILLLTVPLASGLVLSRLIATEGGIQGRQLLPMLPALALLLVIGYRQFLPGRWFWWGSGVLGVTLAALTLWMPLFVIAPAYAQPPLLAETDLPADMTPLKRTYGDQIELVGYRLGQETVQPGQMTDLTLYWRAVEPIEADYTVFVHALGRNRAKVGEYNGYPGLGTLPTSNWPVGSIIEDRYLFQIEGGAQAPSLLRLNVGLFDFDRLDLPPLPVRDETGSEASSQVAQQVLLADAAETAVTDCAPLPTGPVRFADTIVLECIDQSVADQVTFYWSTLQPPSADYTVFIQLWQAGQPIIGFDGPPFGGDFPTSYWGYGLGSVGDTHLMDLSGVADGTYRLVVGLYDPQSGERLSAVSADGQPLPDYAVDLGEIQVGTN
jgi:hypothetical protein